MPPSAREKELQAENERLRQQGISGMFKSLQDALAHGQEQTNLKLEQILEKFNSLSDRTLTLEQKKIPKIEEQIIELQKQKMACPMQNGTAKKEIEELKIKIEDVDKKTEVAQIMQRYPKLVYWIFGLMFGLSTGNGIWELVKKLFE